MTYSLRWRAPVLSTQPSVPLDPQFQFFCKFGSSFQPSLPAVAGQRECKNPLVFSVKQLEVSDSVGAERALRKAGPGILWWIFLPQCHSWGLVLVNVIL